MSRHLAFPLIKKYGNFLPPDSFIEWWIDLVLYLADLMIIPDIIIGAHRIFKPNIRKLNAQELSLAKEIYEDTIDYQYVRMDDKASLGIDKIALAYVSFNMINYKKQIRKDIFIHELMHVWQYQNFGSIYIARAIKAHREQNTYDYGGVSHLLKIMTKGGSLFDFNFEQQAEIIEDYFKIRKRIKEEGPINLSVYGYFAADLHRFKTTT